MLPDVEVATVRRILSALKTRTATKILSRLRDEDPGLARRALSSSGTPRLWQAGGGFDRNIHYQKEFMEKLQYIENNPVARGLVARAEDYKWSSAGSSGLGRDRW